MRRYLWLLLLLFVGSVAAEGLPVPPPTDTAAYTITLQALMGDTAALMLRHDGSILVDSALDFTTGLSAPAHLEGRLFYDDPNKAMAYYNNDADILMQIGQETWTRVRNISGATILNGRAVYITGGSAMLPTIDLAKADVIGTAKCIGLATHDIENNSNGFVTTVGEVRGLNVNLTNFADGDSLFLSDDTAGAWEVTQPLICVPIGWVNNAHATTGVILVDRLHNVIDTQTVFGLDDFVVTRVNDSAAAVRDDIRDTVAILPITADTGAVNFNPPYLGGGFIRQELSVAIRAWSGTAYLIIDNEHGLGTSADSIEFWLSTDGDGAGVERYTHAVADSVALTAGTANTVQENYVYFRYGGGSPVFVNSTANISHTETGQLIDSVIEIVSVGLGEVTGTSVDIRYEQLTKPYLYKFVQRATHPTDIEWHEGVTLTVENAGQAVQFSRGTVEYGTDLVRVPATGNRPAHANTLPFVVPVFSDSTGYAVFDSISGIADYADGPTIATGGQGDLLWLTFWGAASDADSLNYVLYMNVQTSAVTFNTIANAEAEFGMTVPTSIPPEFHETGFLIAAVLYHAKNDSIMDLSDGTKYVDLRGLRGGTSGGGGAPPTDSSTIDGWNFALLADIRDSVEVSRADSANFLGTDTARVLLSDRVDTSTAGLVFNGGNITMAGTETVDGVDISALNTDIAADSVGWNVAADAIPYDTLTLQALLWNPDLITDTIPIHELDSVLETNGIIIDNLSVLTSEDGAYSLQFLIFTAADPPTLHDEVDTLVVGASDQFVSSNTFENVDAQTLDVGQRLYMLTPGTDIDWIKIKVRYHKLVP